MIYHKRPPMKLLLIAIITVFTSSCNNIHHENKNNTSKVLTDSTSYENKITEVMNENHLEDTYAVNEPFLPIKEFEITKNTKQFKFQDYHFKVYWNDHFNYSENLEKYVGGIAKLEILKNNILIQVIDTIKDEDALGKIHLTFADYNFDRLIDFTLPLGTCGKGCYYKYYLFNTNERKFVYESSWDYIQINKVKPAEKLIQTVVERSCCLADYTIYKVDSLKLTEVKKIHSGK